MLRLGARSALTQRSPLVRSSWLAWPPDEIDMRPGGDTFLNSTGAVMRKPEQVIDSVVSKLKKHGKGIVLMHDFQHPTSLALPERLVQLKTSGFKIVQVKANVPVQTLAEYDQELEKRPRWRHNQLASNLKRGANDQ